MNSEYSIEEMAEVLEVSKSGFHAHGGKDTRPRRRRDAELRLLIRGSFEQGRRTYGCPRIRLDLRDDGHRCGKNRVNRLMREQGLRPKQKCCFQPRTTEEAAGNRAARRVGEQTAATITGSLRTGTRRCPCRIAQA